ncbi:hypothetical protein B0T22DRAFT_121510 [Podospora appendiculata]|uniref:Uncharacterized protein n=1 Tax=Podospora appendiculata TaxID=314037 RepID=A0AAE0X6P2_9PEZI|nr:hypothetical protein B0T22DRAFT_121510 [Podospora appendiculata]
MIATASNQADEMSPRGERTFGGAVRARNLVALSDAELDRYLEQHRLDDDVAIDIDVEDPENLPESFIQRLRDRTQNMSDLARAGAVNLDEVNARLLAAASSSTLERASSPPYVRGRSPTQPLSPPQGRATRNYDKLVKDGGRPMFPLELMDNVAKSPTAYRHLLRPWSTLADADYPEWWLIFETQLYHWECFRRWQAHNRNEGPPSHVQIRYSSRWEYVDCAYNAFVRHFRLDSPSYSTAASALLAKYRVTRPVQFHQDPAQQDKLTEWIEYLAFECAVRDQYARGFQRLQLHHDEAWKTLVNSSLLRPFETEEYICDANFGQDYQPEKDQLDRALRLAESALEAARKGSTSRPGPRSTRFLTVAAATTKFDEAKEALQLYNRRMSLIAEFRRGTENFYVRKEDLKRQECLVQWILDEMQLVEAELRKSGISEADPDDVSDTLTAGHDREGTAAVSHQEARKRRREEIPTNDAMPVKRLKTVNRQNNMDAGEARSLNVPTLGPQPRSQRRRHPTTSDPPPRNSSTPVPPRRSARIAVRQQVQSQRQSQAGAALPPISGGPRRITQPPKPRGSPSSKVSGRTAETTKPNKRSGRRRPRH